MNIHRLQQVQEPEQYNRNAYPHHIDTKGQGQLQIGKVFYRADINGKEQVGEQQGKMGETSFIQCAWFEMQK